jgi:hypothetical protein
VVTFEDHDRARRTSTGRAILCTMKLAFDRGRPLSEILAAAHARIRDAVHHAPEADVLAADPDEWAERLASSERLEAPVVHVDDVEYTDEGPTMVDCTGWSGVPYSISEHPPYMRDGRRIRLRIPVSGSIDLVTYSTPQMSPEPHGEFDGSAIVGDIEWPLILANDMESRVLRPYFERLRTSAARLNDAIDRFNGELPAFAHNTILDRQRRLREHGEFFAKLAIPITPRSDAPKGIPPPPIRPKPKRRPKIDTSPRPAAIEGPELGEFYDAILATSRAMGRAMERSPGSYASKREEELRDHLLTILDTHWEGQTFAEAFRKQGKTDILIMWQGRAVFIAECKWWGGRQAMDDALDQLYGYSTWRDSRLALIVFVRNRNFTTVLDRARDTLEQRPEFTAWLPPTDVPGEMRCRIRWPDDPGREAALTLQLFHIPDASTARDL